MVQIHPGPLLIAAHSARHSRAGRSLADRRTDIAEAGGAEPPRRTISTSSRSSADLERPASNRRVVGAIPTGSTIFPRRSPTAEALRSERSQCGCKSCRRDHSRSRSPMKRQRTYTPLSVGANPTGSTSSQRPRSPTAEALRSERSQCGCESCCRDHSRSRSPTQRQRT